MFKYVCKLVWLCVYGQLGECMCSSRCGSVCVVDWVHVCVQVLGRGHDTLALLGGEKAIVRV